jgi:hypothetical protein
MSGAQQEPESDAISRTIRAKVRDASTPEPVAVAAGAAPTVTEPVPSRVQSYAAVPVEKSSPDATTIRTPRPDVTAEGATAQNPGYTFAIQDEEQDDMPQNTPWWRRRSVAAIFVVGVLASAGVAARSFLSPSAPAAVAGTLVVNTNPPGIGVVLDGKRSGETPVSLQVSPGDHVLTLLTEGRPRTIPVTITAGSTVSQFVEVPRAVAETGQLQIRTEPSGARVVVDGTPRGAAPLLVENLAPGSHTVEVSHEGATIRQEITVAAGVTASLVVPMVTGVPANAPISGWISVSAPADVQVFEDARLIGSSRSDRLMMAVGRHELDIVNESLGFRAKRVVTVAPGQVSAIKLDWPNGSMALNAQPWAEVFIDGERVGETPIGNVVVPIGSHEVRFRHPELGEQVVRSTVTLGSPARLSVDLRKR